MLDRFKKYMSDNVPHIKYTIHEREPQLKGNNVTFHIKLDENTWDCNFYLVEECEEEYFERILDRVSYIFAKKYYPHILGVRKTEEMKNEFNQYYRKFMGKKAL